MLGPEVLYSQAFKMDHKKLMNDMSINLDELNRILDKLFAHLKKNGVNDIELTKDFYWYISENQVYNPYNKPTELTLGQLTDNWNELIKTLEEDNDLIAYNFVWAATILRALGEKIVP